MVATTAAGTGMRLSARLPLTLLCFCLCLAATLLSARAGTPTGSPADTAGADVSPGPAAGAAPGAGQMGGWSAAGVQEIPAPEDLSAGQNPSSAASAEDGQPLAPPRIQPAWLSLLPPLLAIGLALIARQVLVALFLGVWLGSSMLNGWNPLLGFLQVGDHFLLTALADRDHAAILIFTTLLGGMVGIMARSGASEGLVSWLSGRVSDRTAGQRTTAIMGTVIFFDDYANTLLVGNSMRPLTDRLRISREKLAYLVDSTAAPITTVAVVSTWIGFEVGLIQDAMQRLGLTGGAYTFFLRTIPYSFYPLLTIWFVYLVAWLGRDFGPMAHAEARAYQQGQVLRPGAQPATDTDQLQSGAGGRPGHPLLAIVPVLVVILGTVWGLWYDGSRALAAAGTVGHSPRLILEAADSFAVLMWSSLGGSAVALGLAWGSRRLSLPACVEGWLGGARAVLIALTILLLAWSLSAVCESLGTASFLVEFVRGTLSPHLLPAVSFLVAAVVSFATGTSWGTMAILLPLVFPLATLLPAEAGLAAGAANAVQLASVRGVLAGAVFGDHCSPISDTTILSSLAAGSDHVDHVRTQMPYAALVALVALSVGYIPAGWGVPVYVSLLMGAGLLLGLLLWRGRRPDA
jgi:Na+/H+ antiporter NhaC